MADDALLARTARAATVAAALFDRHAGPEASRLAPLAEPARVVGEAETSRDAARAVPSWLVALSAAEQAACRQLCAAHTASGTSTEQRAVATASARATHDAALAMRSIVTAWLYAVAGNEPKGLSALRAAGRTLKPHLAAAAG